MGSKSKRMKSSMRHKIVRKKRENKRDLRRAAKAMTKSGLKVRSKKSREEAKLALKISNANPDKEEILANLLRSREEARVLRSTKRLQRQEDALRERAAEKESGDEESDEEEEEGWESASDASSTKQSSLPAPSAAKARLLFPHTVGSNFKFQFNAMVDQLALPTAASDESAPLPLAFVVTVDVRCAVQSLPLELLDRVVAAARERSSALRHSVLLLVVATKCDLVSAQAIGSAMALVSEALRLRYMHGDSGAALGAVRFAFAPFSPYFDKTGKHVLAVLRNFAGELHGDQENAAAAAVRSGRTNMKEKLCAVVLGFPNTGRRTLTRALQEVGTDTAVSVTPASSLQRVLVQRRGDGDNAADDAASSKRPRKEPAAVPASGAATEQWRIVVPNAKQVTFLTLPEDVELQRRSKAVSSGDIAFHSFSFIEKLAEPEAVAPLIIDAAIDKIALAQCFSLPLLAPREGADGTAAAMSFLKRLGANIRRDNGFVFASPLLSSAGTAGQLTASSLTASQGFAARQDSNRPTFIGAYSGAVPGKVIRMTWSRTDAKNALKLGSRAFLKEWHSGRHLPWAVLRPLAGPAQGPDYIAAREAQKNCVFTAQYIPARAINVASEQDAADGQSEVFAKNLAALSFVLKDYFALLPHSVVEFAPHCVAPEQHNVAE